MAHELGERIGTGGSADVFEYGSDAVLKLFRPQYGYAAEMEAERTRAVHEAGIPAPRFFDIVELGNRRGIILERVEGRTLVEEMMAGRTDARSAGAITAEVQAAVNDMAADLPRLSDVVDLGALTDGSAVSHLDLHPGNVIMSPRGPVVIDWVNAHLAAAAADVARSVMTIRYQGLGLLGADGGLDEERRVRTEVLHGYTDRLRDLSDPPDGLDQWLGRTAARLLAAEPDNPDATELRHLVDAAT
jgi:aminoglycoside phosphotransferase (APT) family kinase protein